MTKGGKAMKKFLAMLLALIMMTAVVACHAAEKEVTLMVINSFTKTPDAPLYKAAEKFQRETGIRVNIEPVPATNIKDKFVTSALAGGGPDIVSLDNAGWVPDAAAMGLLAKLDRKFKPLRKQFLDGAVATGLFKGSYYSVPWYTNNTALIYNKKLFQKAGITQAPTTWNELAEAVKKLKAIGKYGISMPLDSLGGYVIGNFFFQNGNPIIDTKGAKPKVVLNNKSGQEAFKFVTELHTKYKAIPESSKAALSWDQTFAPFIQEDAGMLLCGDWAIGAIRAGNPNLDYGIAPLPKGRVNATTLGGYVLCINKNTKDFEASWKFLSWLTAKGQNNVLLDYFRIGARKDIDETALLKQVPYFEVFIAQGKYGKARPVIQRWEDMQKALGDAFTAVFIGGADYKEALKRCERTLNEIIASSNR